MGKSLEHFIYTILYAFIFAGALVAAMYAFRVIKQDEKIINSSNENKSSVYMAEGYDKNTEEVTMTSSDVYHSIISLIDNYDEDELEAMKIRIYVTRMLTSDEMIKIKRRSASALENLQVMVNSYNEYRCIYTVDEELKLTAVEYRSS